MSAINSKKIIFLVLCLIGIPFSTFAITTSNNQPIVNCPRNITCATEGQASSCKISDNSYEIWREHPYESNLIIKGTYRLYMVKSGYKHSRGQFCIYSIYDDHNIWKSVTLYPKDYDPLRGGWKYGSTKLIANFTDSSSWINPQEFQGEAFCESAQDQPLNPKACPLVEEPRLLYSPAEKSDPAGFYYGNSFNLIEIDYNTLLSTCGATTVCKINVGNYYLYKDKYYLDQNYGTVTVDTMVPDVLTINNLKTDNDSPCTLKKKEPFNTIYCETNSNV